MSGHLQNKKNNHTVPGGQSSLLLGIGLLIVFLQSFHEVPAALDVSPLDVWVETGSQGQLKCLAGHRLGRAVHDEVPSREPLMEITLFQV